MRNWRIPVVVSALAHGALVATFWLAEEETTRRPGAAEPLEIRINEIVLPERKETVAPETPAQKRAAVTSPKRTRQRRRKPRVTAPVDPQPERSEDPGGTLEDEGGIILVPAPDRTADGRALAELDLGLRAEIPAFEAQGPGVRLPAPREDPRKKKRPDGGYDFEDKAFTARVAPDGTVRFDDRGYREPQSPTRFTFDVTDWLMAANGDDTYAYEKRKFLDATREQRLEMARIACGKRLSQSLVDLPRRLEQVWKSSRPADRKRQILFDMWDECTEDGSDEQRRYGELARATILDFIQENLPRESEHAFTAVELEALNRRRYSRRAFDPYDEGTL